MKRFEILNAYKRYLNALRDKKRDMFEDAGTMVKWLFSNLEEDELTYQMIVDLTFDSLWRVYTSRRVRGISYLKESGGAWDTAMLDTAKTIITNLKNAEDVGDNEKVKLLNTTLFVKFIFPCMRELDMPALGCYILALLNGKSRLRRECHSVNHNWAEIYLSCGDEETLDACIAKRCKKVEQTSTGVGNIHTNNSVWTELIRREYDAWQNDDVYELEAVLEQNDLLLRADYFPEDMLQCYRGLKSLTEKHIRYVRDGVDYDDSPTTDFLDAVTIDASSVEETE